MADLSAINLLDHLPAGSYTATADDVVISMKTVMGETSVSELEPKVSEFIAKLLDACRKAQLAYNAVEGNTPISSYNASTFNTPTQLADGSFIARRNYSLSVAIPLQMDEITAV